MSCSDQEGRDELRSPPYLLPQQRPGNVSQQHNDDKRSDAYRRKGRRRQRRRGLRGRRQRSRAQGAHCRRTIERKRGVGRPGDLHRKEGVCVCVCVCVCVRVCEGKNTRKTERPRRGTVRKVNTLSSPSSASAFAAFGILLSHVRTAFCIGHTFSYTQQ